MRTFTDSAHLHRLRLSNSARAWLFRCPRLWAETRNGDFAGKACNWTDVQVLIFPHGAILSIDIDWLCGVRTSMRNEQSRSCDMFTLHDMRTWTYIAKFRSIKIGVTRGWTFARHDALATNELISQATSLLGLKIFAALYGGSGISLSSIANWLIKLPSDGSCLLPRRVPRFDYCLHHSLVIVDRPPCSDLLVVELLFHIRRAYNSGENAHAPQDDLNRAVSDQLLHLRSNIILGVAREGVLGFAWGLAGFRTFQKEFWGLFSVLTLHCLVERTTLDKLSYLSAVQSQSLPTNLIRSGPSDRVARKTIDGVRDAVLQLSMLVERYRAGLASEGCGGRPELREYFIILRQLHCIGELKSELNEEVSDMLSIVNRDWMELRQIDKRTDLTWKLQRDDIQKRINNAENSTKLLFDITSNAFVALTFPFVLGVNLFSMNLPSVPRYVPWVYVLIGSGVVSILSMIVFMTIYFCDRSAILAIKAEKRQLNLEWARSLQKSPDDISEKASSISIPYITPADVHDQLAQGDGTIQSFWKRFKSRTANKSRKEN